MKAGIAVLFATGLLIFAAYKLSPVTTAKSGVTRASSVRTGTAQSTPTVPDSKAEMISGETPPASESGGAESSADSSPSHPADSPTDAAHTLEQDGSSPSSSAASHWYGEPPHVNADISVEDAYAAIPHRRTVWRQDDSTVPASERDYLSAMFHVLDQAVVVQVAGTRSYQRKDFDGFDAEGNLDRLIDYVQNTQAPPRLRNYNGDIVTALSGERQFFRDWKNQPDSFNYAGQVGSHQGLTQADVALHAAYQELMTKYPHESQANQDAFYDYHCGADFR